MTNSASEIIILKLGNYNNNEVQDLVLCVEFDYNFSQPLVMDEPKENIEIIFKHIYIHYKKSYTDETPQNVEIPIDFFTFHMLEHIKECVIENLAVEDEQQEPDFSEETEDF